nr:hypothetical protein GCM10025730_29370 [Promicromonospora thailandica]
MTVTRAVSPSSTSTTGVAVTRAAGPAAPAAGTDWTVTARATAVRTAGTAVRARPFRARLRDLCDRSRIADILGFLSTLGGGFTDHTPEYAIAQPLLTAG